MKQTFLLFTAGISLLVSVSAFSQKKNYTIAEATNGISTNLKPKALLQTSFQPGTNRLFQVIKDSISDRYEYVDAATGKGGTFTDLTSINTSVAGRDTLKSMPTMVWLDQHTLYFSNDRHLWIGTVPDSGNNINWRLWATLPEKNENVNIDKYRNVYFTVENNLWMIQSGVPVQITRDGDKNVINGQAVHRNEFGIETGIFPGPKGHMLAYYHMDQTLVNDYPIIHWGETPATVDLIKYPMAGGTSHHVNVMVYDPVNRLTLEIKTEGPLDQYLTAVTWSPDERYIFIGVLNRDQNHLCLNQYDARTGMKVRTLFEETSDKYVEPTHPLSFLPNSNSQFIWWSYRDGYQHLYLFDTTGKMIRNLTPGDYEVNDLLAFNEKKKEILFTSAKESPLEKHGYAVNWSNGKMRRLDKDSGTHNYLFSENGRYALDVFTATGVAKRCNLLSTDGKMMRTLLDSPNPLATYDRPIIKDIVLHAADGTPLYGKLILPTHMDPTKKYPVIVYLYNGPHVQLIRNAFPESGNLWYEYMAQKGYVVFSMDGRGSSNRGLAFEQATFRHLGDKEMEDQLTGVQYLKSLPYVDSTRMGVHGWSYGGFMTTSLMLRHPGVFKCAVAGGPVMDWSMYEVMYTERYMDTPQQNPDGYAENNLITKVANLKGKLLLIHGTDDNTVVWQHSIKFLKACVDKNVQVDYFVYPGYEHNVRGKDRVHLMQKVSDYFDLWLKP